MGIPRTLRDFQAGWKSRFLDFSIPRLFHNPWHGLVRQQQLSFRAVSAQALRSVGDRKGSIQMLMHPYRAARQGRSPAHRFDLQAEMLKAHRVVAIHRPLKLQAENQVQVLTSPGQKGRAPFRRPPAPLRPSGNRSCLAWSPTLAARKADRSCAISTGHIMC